jgi:hypothetical protein
MRQNARMTGGEEDLAEALRRIVVLLQPSGRRRPSEREWAALAIACDALDLGLPQARVDPLLISG